MVIKPEGRRDLYLVQPLSGGRVEIMQLLKSHFRPIVSFPESWYKPRFIADVVTYATCSVELRYDQFNRSTEHGRGEYSDVIMP